MTAGSTIRTYLEAIRDLTIRCNCHEIDDCHVCESWAHAVAALRILDEAGTTVTFYDYGELPHEVYRLVPDPEPNDA